MAAKISWLFVVHVDDETWDKKTYFYRHKMSSLSFTNFKDKGFDFNNIIDVSFPERKNFRNIWPTVVLKNMLHDGFTFPQHEFTSRISHGHVLEN